jgi:ABC-type bacteriocin/lantibiotic exporter with double-glycine peptidase domain
MVAHCHGLGVTPHEIRSRVEVAQGGAPLGGLARAAAAVGLSAQAVRVSPAQWRHVHVPAVATGNVLRPRPAGQ